jgi:hypothetical protein
MLPLVATGSLLDFVLENHKFSMPVGRIEYMMLSNSRPVCEQFVGQHLLYRQHMFRQPELYYWLREQPSSSADRSF